MNKQLTYRPVPQYNRNVNRYGRPFTQRQLEKRAAARKAAGVTVVSHARLAKQAAFRARMNELSGLPVDNVEYDEARGDMAASAARAVENIVGPDTAEPQGAFRRLRQSNNSRSAPKQTNRPARAKPPSRPSGPKRKSKSTQRKERESSGGSGRSCPKERKSCGGGKPVSVVGYARDSGCVVKHCRGTPF